MIKIFPNIEELNTFAAEKLVEIAADAIEQRGQFTVALAGGSTPKSLYRLLASNDFRDKIDWKSVYFFFGDERNVLPLDAESNFRMVKENLFEMLKTQPTKIYRWETEFEDHEKIVYEYEESVKYFFRGFPTFDLILLGMGDDGHTASLFPFTNALNETEKIAAANYVEKFNSWRFTLTYPTINSARNIIFLVAGEGKAETLRDVLEGEFQPEKLPSQNVKPADGNLFWLCDAKSAALLNTE